MFLIHMCDVTNSFVRWDSSMYVTWIIHVRDVTLSWSRAQVRDWFMCVTWIMVKGPGSWLIHMCNVTHSDGPWFVTHSYVQRDSFGCVTWIIRMGDKTHSDVWHDSFLCVTWLIQMCAITHSNAWHDSFICVTWLFRTCDMTHSYVYVIRSDVWHESFIRVTRLIQDYSHSFIHVTWLIHTCGMTWLIDIDTHIHMCDVTQAYGWHDSFIKVTWLIHICDTYKLIHGAEVSWVMSLSHATHMNVSRRTHEYVVSCVNAYNNTYTVYLKLHVMPKYIMKYVILLWNHTHSRIHKKWHILWYAFTHGDPGCSVARIHEYTEVEYYGTHSLRNLQSYAFTNT